MDLAADGIQLGDWYVIYAIEPGQRVSVANSVHFHRATDAIAEPTLEATGPVELSKRPAVD